MTLLFDPLRRLPPRWRIAGYALLCAHFGRLYAWYAITERWGKA